MRNSLNVLLCADPTWFFLRLCDTPLVYRDTRVRPAEFGKPNIVLCMGKDGNAKNLSIYTLYHINKQSLRHHFGSKNGINISKKVIFLLLSKKLSIAIVNGYNFYHPP